MCVRERERDRHESPLSNAVMAAKRKGKKQEEENVQLGPQVAEGENVFGVAHIFASFNDTFVHVTDLSGRWVWLHVLCVYQRYDQTMWAQPNA